MVTGPAPRPCESCPYRRDVPSGVWSRDEYAKLLLYDAETYDQPLELFQCHQNGRDDDLARLCAGWVACHGVELLSLRVAVSAGRVAADVMDYSTSVPVFGSGAEAAAHGLRDIACPSEAACDLIDKIVKVRPDVEPVYLNGGRDILVGEAARKYREALDRARTEMSQSPESRNPRG